MLKKLKIFSKKIRTREINLSPKILATNTIMLVINLIFSRYHHILITWSAANKNPTKKNIY